MKIHLNINKRIIFQSVLVIIAGIFFFQAFISESEKKEWTALLANVSEKRPESSFIMQFEKNEGQTDKQVKFLSRGAGFTNFLTKKGNVLKLKKSSQDTSTVLNISFKKANEDVEIISEGTEAGVYNYFIGNDPSKWLTGVPTFPTIRYKNLYNNIDALYTGTQDKLNYDFEVRPGGKPEHIIFIIEGASDLGLDSNGNFVMKTQQGIVTMDKPQAFQVINGVKKDVKIEYKLKKNKNELSFKIGNYNKKVLLTIDPVLIFSSFIGGTATDVTHAITVNSANNVYIAGFTESTDFPVVSGVQTNIGGSGGDAFIARLNNNGVTMSFATYLGGSTIDYASSIVLDSSDNIYVAGVTTSGDFPNSNAVQTSLLGSSDMFVAKLNSTGSTLQYSTYLGGTADDSNSGVGVDGSNSVYVLGQTNSSDYPLVSPLQNTYQGGTDLVLTKLNSIGNSIVYSTYLGGTGGEFNGSLAVNTGGNAFVAADTTSSDLATVSSFQSAYGGGSTDGFVAKLNTAGSSYDYLTYIGGSEFDQVSDVALDASSNAYVVGYTNSTNFPTASPIQVALAGGKDAFITKINSTGSALTYSTYFGGSGNDQAAALAINSSNEAFFAGTTYSSDITIVNSLQSVLGGEADAFVVKLNAGGSSVLTSTYFGGSGFEEVSNFAIRQTTDFGYLVGITQSSDFPTRIPLQGIFKDGGGDGFVVIMNLAI